MDSLPYIYRGFLNLQTLDKGIVFFPSTGAVRVSKSSVRAARDPCKLSRLSKHK